MIRRKLIKDEANALLEKAGITRPPVDVERLAINQGAVVINEPNDSDTSGFLFQTPGNRPVIGVNSKHPVSRRRFTIAHELGHLILHTKKELHVDRAVVKMRDLRASEGLDHDEIEANRFAAEILMPLGFLEADLKALGPVNADDEVTIRKLAKIYGVSQQAMTIRLTSLKLVWM
jgi:Zn-dependent peptidase ImmA (M78 family)